MITGPDDWAVAKVRYSSPDRLRTLSPPSRRPSGTPLRSATGRRRCATRPRLAAFNEAPDTVWHAVCESREVHERRTRQGARELAARVEREPGADDAAVPHTTSRGRSTHTRCTRRLAGLLQRGLPRLLQLRVQSQPLLRLLRGLNDVEVEEALQDVEEPLGLLGFNIDDLTCVEILGFVGRQVADVPCRIDISLSHVGRPPVLRSSSISSLNRGREIPASLRMRP